MTITPEDRAKSTLDDIERLLGTLHDPEDNPIRLIHPGFVEHYLAVAIHAAIADEREACAKVAEMHMQPELDAYANFGDRKPPLVAARIRNEIRARGDMPIPTKKGDIIRCPNGHEIAELLDDIAIGEYNYAHKIGKWRQTPAAVGSKAPVCEICGKPWLPNLFQTG